MSENYNCLKCGCPCVLASATEYACCSCGTRFSERELRLHAEVDSEIARMQQQSGPAIVSETRCPNCGNELHFVRSRYPARWWQCIYCGAELSQGAMERLWSREQTSEARQCYLEEIADKKRAMRAAGVSGGGSSTGKAKKDKPARPGQRAVGDPLPWWADADEAEPEAKTERLRGARTNKHKVNVPIDEEIRRLEAELGVNGPEEMRKAVAAAILGEI